MVFYFLCCYAYALIIIQCNKIGSERYVYFQTDYPLPWISCPENVHVILSPGANTADVSALLQDPTSNQPPSRITITPGQFLVDKIFPAGTTTLTYVARNQNGKTAQCQMDVVVEGISFDLYSDPWLNGLSFRAITDCH